MKRIINYVLFTVFVLASVNFANNCMDIYSFTKGRVQGTEFLMLIMLNNLLANFGLWLLATTPLVLSRLNWDDFKKAPVKKEKDLDAIPETA